MILHWSYILKSTKFLQVCWTLPLNGLHAPRSTGSMSRLREQEASQAALQAAIQLPRWANVVAPGTLLFRASGLRNK